jgi:CBS domain containing-hemolysin-like protein
MSTILIIFICLVTSAFFSGSEIAFISSNKLKIELDRKQNRGFGGLVGWFIERPEHFIATMLVGNNISLVVYGLQMALLLEPLISRIIPSDIWVLIIQTVIATALILLTAEFLPKTLFRLRPNRMIRNLAPVLLFFYIILYPITWISINISNLLLKYVFKAESVQDDNSRIFSRIDLTNLVQETIGNDSGDEMIEQEMRLFQNALDFGEVRLKECMIPRTELVSIDANDQIEELKQRLVESGYSRILVYDENIDNIIGYVHHSDLFFNPESIRSIIRPIQIVPEAMPANKLLKMLLDEQKNSAIVVDEFGGTAGLVTVEDVLEEIFGEIEDEHDKLYLEEVVVNDNVYRLSGRLEIDYLNDKYSLNLPESDDFETLAGLLLARHESIPRVGETIWVDSYEFTIIKATNTRIESVRLTVHS